MWGVIITFALSAQHRRAERTDTALSAVSFQAPSHRAARSSPSPAEQMRGRVSLKEGTACAKSLQNTMNVRRHQHQHPRIPHTVLKDTLRNSIKLPPRCPFMAPSRRRNPRSPASLTGFHLPRLPRLFGLLLPPALRITVPPPSKAHSSLLFLCH